MDEQSAEEHQEETRQHAIGPVVEIEKAPQAALKSAPKEHNGNADARHWWYLQAVTAYSTAGGAIAAILAGVFTFIVLIRSLGVAKLALAADSPYLVVEKMLHNWLPEEPSTGKGPFNLLPVDVTLHNFGKGPALIDNITGVIKPGAETRRVPARLDQTDCEGIDAPFKAVSADGTKYFSIIIQLPFTVEQFRVDQRTLIDVYGKVVHRDIFDRPYETAFSWWVFRRLHQSDLWSSSSLALVI